MTPEHVSELQSILRFLRSNAFAKSEATLIKEVEGLMQQAQDEKDEVERSLASEETSSNHEVDHDTSQGTHTTELTQGFGPMSPPTVSNATCTTLGRFGSNVEQAHGLMLFEDQVGAQSRKNENDYENDDDDCSSTEGTLDTFATPTGAFAEGGTYAASNVDEEDTGGMRGDNNGGMGIQSQDDAVSISRLKIDSDSDSASEKEDDAHDISFAEGVSLSPRHAEDTNERVDDQTNYPYSQDDEDSSAHFHLLYDQSYLGESTSETQKVLSENWQSQPIDEYSDCEDCGYLVIPVSPDEHQDFLRREIVGVGEVFGGGGYEETGAEGTGVEDDSQINFGEFIFSGKEIPSCSTPSTPDAPPVGDGFVFDSSPPGSATTNSETGAAGKQIEGMGWGGSEFGGDSEGPMSQSLSPLPSPRASDLNDFNDNLDSAADALRAWVQSKEDTDAAGDTGGVDTDAVDTTARETAAGETIAAIAGDNDIASVPPPQQEESETDFESFTLNVIHKKHRTGFEASKNFPIEIGGLIAGRYRVKSILGSAAFSTAVCCTDEQGRMGDGMSKMSDNNRKQSDTKCTGDESTSVDSLVCLKIVKNSKEFLDQSLDEVKLLKLVGDGDPGNKNGIVKMKDFFYHREHLFIVTELLGLNLYEHQKKCLLEQAEYKRYQRRRRRNSNNSFASESDNDMLSERSSDSRPVSPTSRGSSPRQADITPPPTYFTLKSLRHIAFQILTSLEFMHSRDLIHCDVKPENITLQLGSENVQNRKVKVIDLGSSCFTTDHLSGYVQSRSYRAPEVTIGHPYDQKVDIWSLGCVLCELWSGEVLLRNENTPSCLARIISIFGPFDLAFLAKGKLTREVITASGVPYERTELNDDRFRDDEKYESDTEEFLPINPRHRSFQILCPKRTSLAHRLGLPPIGVPYPEDKKNTPAPTPFPAGLFKTAGANGMEGTECAVIEEPTEEPGKKKLSKSEEKDLFLDFLINVLKPDPGTRLSAKEALRHPWLVDIQSSDDFGDFEDCEYGRGGGASGHVITGDHRERDILAQL